MTMNWNIFDYGIIAFAIFVGIGITVSYFLLCNDAHQKTLLKTYLVVSVCFLLFCFCGYVSSRLQVAAQDLETQEIYVDNHKATCYGPDQIDDNLCNVEIPEEGGSYRHYLHSRNCPCFRPLKDTVVVDGHKYLKMHKAYYHAPTCN